MSPLLRECLLFELGGKKYILTSDNLWFLSFKIKEKYFISRLKSGILNAKLIVASEESIELKIAPCYTVIWQDDGILINNLPGIKPSTKIKMSKLF